MRFDIAGVEAFLAVAQERSFRRGADALGLTHSAVSQGVRRLEDRLGASLLNRTTRSVHLTEAGTALFERLKPAFDEIGSALDAAREDNAEASGTIRLAIAVGADRFLSGPLLAEFTRLHPRITLDITVTDGRFDALAEGYDAGVTYTSLIDRNAVAIPVAGIQRQVVVASPRYLAENGTPTDPSDLAAHICIGWKLSPRSAEAKWEFVSGGKSMLVPVQSNVTTNDMMLMLNLAKAGGGITCCIDDICRPFIDSGELVELLPEHSAQFGELSIYVPSIKNLPRRLRLLLDHVKFNLKLRVARSA